MKKRALISVYDKTGIDVFCKELQSRGVEIVSTGGTLEYLKKNNITVTPSEEITGFSQLLDGKVKTLHPKIYAGILANIQKQKEFDEIANANIEPFSLVVVNLYPFEQLAQRECELEDLIKNIDIGGVCMLRAAAKNYENVGVITNINDYDKVLKELKENNGELSLDTKQNLALNAFFVTSKYDGIILETLAKKFEKENFKSIKLEKIKDLRYGENPHQKATLYKNSLITDYEILNGKELSYNNILDITSAVNIVSEFYDVAAVAIVKHNNPCGVALGKDLNDAYLKAFDCDPISAFGGIIAFSQTVDVNIAKHASSVFLEVLIAPDFTEEALEILKTKKNLRIVKLNTQLKDINTIVQEEIKVTPFGTLIQSCDNAQLNKDTFKVVSKAKPSVEMVEDMVFAFKVAKYVKSNAIVVAKDFKTLGICGGQTSRVDAVEIALNRACENAKDAVLASDGFFPAIDNIEAAAQCRIAGIIQPGGSIKDKDVIDAVNKFNMVMITTGIRHFKH